MLVKVVFATELVHKQYCPVTLVIGWAATHPCVSLVFGLAGELEHRVTDVEGLVLKTAFAGWFRSQPDFLSLRKSASGEQR